MVLIDLAADAPLLGHPHDDADHDQHGSDHVGLAPGGVGLFVEEVSDDANRNGCDGQQPEEIPILPEIGIAPEIQSESLADDLDPIAKEVDDHRHQRARVQRDIERQAAVLPTEEPRDQDQMRGAANGQKFGERLHNRQNDHLVNGHELAS